VLIVDESDDTREVLRTILERRGVETWEARAAEHGLDLVARCDPDLIVLDLETLPAQDGGMRDRYDRQSRCRKTPMVLLGTTKATERKADTNPVVDKPYHYASLIRTIEDLLRQSTEEPSA
jgi:CheY-like chemotaxis protein